MTEHLYTPTDVKKVREKLLKEQHGYDKLTGLEIPKGQAVTDHNHKTQFVRGILHRQCNVVLGKIENLWTRYLSYWYPGTLSQFLRQASTYIDAPDDKRYLHPGWIRKIQTMYNALPESSKRVVLASLGQDQGNNSTQRKAIFKAVVMSRKYTFEQLKDLINKESIELKKGK